MITEEWKDIPGFEGKYQASTLGNIRSRYRVLKPTTNSAYATVDLQGKVYTVHRLVALTFIPNPEEKPQVNHKDFDRHNSNVDNLEWATAQENVIHSRTRERRPPRKYKPRKCKHCGELL